MMQEEEIVQPQGWLEDVRTPNWRKYVNPYAPTFSDLAQAFPQALRVMTLVAICLRDGLCLVSARFEPGFTGFIGLAGWMIHNRNSRIITNLRLPVLSYHPIHPIDPENPGPKKDRPAASNRKKTFNYCAFPHGSVSWIDELCLYGPVRTYLPHQRLRHEGLQ